MIEERLDQDDIENSYNNKYIGDEFIINVPVEGPRRATVRQHIE